MHLPKMESFSKIKRGKKSNKAMHVNVWICSLLYLYGLAYTSISAHSNLMMPQHQMKRTASMTGLPAAPGDDASPEQTDRHTESHRVSAVRRRRSAKLLPPDTDTFLRACGLCNRLLGPGRDTFMYRGEIAFCSLECREQKIIQDEWMEKCSLASMKKDTPMAAAGTEASSGIETIAAA